MNNTRIAIGIALLMMLSATAFVISDSDNTDAVTVDNIRYNSDLGFEIDVDDLESPFIVVNVLPLSAHSGMTSWSKMIFESGTHILTAGGSEIGTTGPFGYSIRMSGADNIDGSIDILELVFDSNNNTGRTSSVFLSDGYTGYVLSDGEGWTLGDQMIIGWSMIPGEDNEVDYRLGQSLDAITQAMTDDGVMTLYAVYGVQNQYRRAWGK